MMIMYIISQCACLFLGAIVSVLKDLGHFPIYIDGNPPPMLWVFLVFLCHDMHKCDLFIAYYFDKRLRNLFYDLILIDKNLLGIDHYLGT